MRRDGLSQDDASRRIAAQMPQEEKKKFADLLIDTSDGFEAARERTKQVFEQLRTAG
jgi:dephospho-CoA kinase